MLIKDILNLTNKAEIPDVTGKIVKLYERTSKAGQYGLMISQKGVLEDSSGQIQINFKGFDNMSSLQGQTVTMRSSQTQHGLKGLAMNTYTGQKGLVKEIGITGSVKFDDNGSQVTPQTPINEQIEAGMSKNLPWDAPKSPVNASSPTNTGSDKGYIELEEKKRRVSILTSYAATVAQAYISNGVVENVGKKAAQDIIDAENALNTHVFGEEDAIPME